MNVSILSTYPLVIVRITCCGLCLSCLGGLSAQAQITFTANKLPAVVGDYADEYVSTDTDPSAKIGPTGGPQAWDFSYALQSGDIIRRMDIVSPTNGGYQASFPQATYAERYTDMPDNVLEWDYYNIITNVGRYYFGSWVPNTVTNVFVPPPIDIPAVVGYGTNWSYTTTTAAPISEQDTVSVTVDAFGTIILPQLGAFQALRVNQLTTTREFISGQLINTFYIREYYWLVPGFGMAFVFPHPPCPLSRYFSPPPMRSAGFFPLMPSATPPAPWPVCSSNCNWDRQSLTGLPQAMPPPIKSKPWAAWPRPTGRFLRRPPPKIGRASCR